MSPGQILQKKKPNKKTPETIMNNTKVKSRKMTKEGKQKPEMRRISFKTIIAGYF